MSSSPSPLAISCQHLSLSHKQTQINPERRLAFDLFLMGNWGLHSSSLHSARIDEVMMEGSKRSEWLWFYRGKRIFLRLNDLIQGQQRKIYIALWRLNPLDADWLSVRVSQFSSLNCSVFLSLPSVWHWPWSPYQVSLWEISSSGNSNQSRLLNKPKCKDNLWHYIKLTGLSTQ